MRRLPGGRAFWEGQGLQGPSVAACSGNGSEQVSRAGEDGVPVSHGPDWALAPEGGRKAKEALGRGAEWTRTVVEAERAGRPSDSAHVAGSAR